MSLRALDDPDTLLRRSGLLTLGLAGLTAGICALVWHWQVALGVALGALIAHVDLVLIARTVAETFARIGTDASIAGDEPAGPAGPAEPAEPAEPASAVQGPELATVGGSPGIPHAPEALEASEASEPVPGKEEDRPDPTPEDLHRETEAPPPDPRAQRESARVRVQALFRLPLVVLAMVLILWYMPARPEGVALGVVLSLASAVLAALQGGNRRSPLPQTAKEDHDRSA